ncbi:unnamed protein product [Didymodactylos carnosus]|uniref:Ankyrin repeat protein n=1 Tax=Didymodactylos carnosus TaxID=1234261 RepID=A0A815UPB7_9BILA|nr:unnamed protein product [Didymodactylos carnosus]CAF1522645.1 unnamed protein product [Didymodactylos carnosus]CAF4189603.1 unnamed protein product [Didymodactylos carnosus]CAF4381768.1 unnamed protein product [Didymodactylos carnosus]
MVALLYTLLSFIRDEIEEKEKEEYYQLMHKFNRLNFRTNNGSTLLHLAVVPNTFPNEYYIERNCKFPSLSAVQVLIECGGIDVNALDFNRNTPLHLLAIHSCGVLNDETLTTIKLIVKKLNEGGCHWDCINSAGKTAIECTSSGFIQKFIANQMTLNLKCIAAKIVKKSKINYYQSLSKTLCDFTELH